MSIGCVQMKKLPSFIESKRNLFLKYKEVFKSLLGVRVFSEPVNSRSNYWLQTLILDKDI